MFGAWHPTRTFQAGIHYISGKYKLFSYKIKYSNTKIKYCPESEEFFAQPNEML
jgi:hypothetical protein